MPMPAWVNKSLASCYRLMSGRRVRQVFAIATTVVLLIGFGDTLLPLVGHGLHVLVEIIELALEHLLEAAFGLSPRQAQTVLAWGGLMIVLFLSVHFIRKAYRITQRTCLEAKKRWCAFTNSATATAMAWFRALLILGSLGATVYLFT
ncbi:MAG TPA: hypothetical protein VNL74_13040 [Methylococcus sp.]|nr:hypothetical protein [Methylococcus sp.]